MKRSLLILALAVGSLLTAKAQIVQTMNLKNGSVLHGYLKSQKTDGNIVFCAEEAEVVMDGQKVKDISGKKVAYDSLPEAWKHYADENGLLDKNRQLALSSIDTGSMISNVHILEQGKLMKYIELKHDYALRMSDIAFVEYSPREELLLSGINRIFTVKSNDGMRTVEGQCIKEIPSSVTYLLKEDGMVESIDINDLVKDNSVRNNPNQSLFEQSRLLDRITTNESTVYTGIITERNYELPNYSFVITMEADGEETNQTVLMENVAEIGKLVNPKYKEMHDIKLNPGQIMVNRKVVGQEDFVEQNGQFVVTPTMKRVILKLEGKELDIVVEANFKDAKVAADNYFIKANPSEKKDKKHKDLFYFSYRDLVESAIAPVETVTSKHNTTKMTYRVKSKGMYVLFNTNNKKAVLISVE